MSWSVGTPRVKASEFLMEVHKLELPAEHAEAGFLRAFEAGRHALALFFAAESLGSPEGEEFQGYVNGHSYSHEGQEGLQVGCGISRYLDMPKPAQAGAADAE